MYHFAVVQLFSFSDVGDVCDFTSLEPYLDQSWQSQWWWWESAQGVWLQRRSPAPWWPPSRCSSSRRSAKLQRKSEETCKCRPESHKTPNIQRTAKSNVILQVFVMLLFVLKVGPPFSHPREHDVLRWISHNTMQAAEEFTEMEDKQHSSPLYPSVFAGLHVQLLKRPRTPLKVINQSSRSFKAFKSGRSPNRKTRRHNGALCWRKADKRGKKGATDSRGPDTCWAQNGAKSIQTAEGASGPHGFT